MVRGRKPITRSKLAAERFNKARHILGKSLKQILDDQNWINEIDVWDDRTLRRWLKEGIPENRIGAIAHYFGVSRVYFTDSNISEDIFEKAISEASEQLKGSEKEIKAAPGKSYTFPAADASHVEVEVEPLEKMNGASSLAVLTRANMPGGRDRTINSLLSARHRIDPEERYWIYVTLGEIGGKRAHAALMEGLHDTDAYASKGAQDGIKIMRGER